MNPTTLKTALDDKTLSQAMAKEARTIGIQAREDRRALVDQMNQQTQLDVAKAAGATVSTSRGGDTSDLKCSCAVTALLYSGESYQMVRGFRGFLFRIQFFFKLFL